MILVVN